MKDSLFAQKVFAVVAGIPEGSTLTYGEVAILSGSPGAARAVGTLMKHNYRADIPCHRVIRSNGKVGEYNRGGQAEKERKLYEEGWKGSTATG